MNKKSLNWKLLYKGEKKKTLDGILDILVANRGLKSKKQRHEFFNPIHPEEIKLKDLDIDKKGLRKAVKRIEKAIADKERILVFGDYDADGICATAILWEALYKFNKKTVPYIPDRFSEGYGISKDSVKKLQEKYPDLSLIVTVDNGIVAFDAIEAASELGIDVIVTDHHEKGSKLPEAHAIVHTKEIGGAGISWILSRELKRKFQIPNSKYQMGSGLELATIGTIADQLSLLGANRSIVKYGLEDLNKTKRPGLLALLEEAALSKGSIGTYEIGFIIAPRINAMGRLEHALDSLRLLCTRRKKRARKLARTLGRTNKRRQKIVDEVVAHARESAKDKIWKGAILLSHESYHEGVIGLAASKLVDEYYRPAIVVSKGDKYSKASARSVAGFNIIKVIRELDDFISGGGGHAMAAGFTIETEKLKNFSEKLEEISSPLLTDEVLTRELKVDMPLDFGQIDWKLAKKLTDFEPTGIGNPRPTFVTEEVFVLDARTVGSQGNHLKLKLEKDGEVFDAIGFGFGGLFKKILDKELIDVVYNLEINVWNGRKSLQLKIKDLKVKR